MRSSSVDTQSAGHLTLSLSLALIGFGVGYMVGQLGGDFYSHENGVITLRNTVSKVYPANYATDAQRLPMDHTFPNARIVLDQHPIVLVFKGVNNQQETMVLQYQPQEGLTLSKGDTREVVLRYATGIGLVVGSGELEPKSLLALEVLQRETGLTPVYVAGSQTDAKANLIQLTSQVMLGPDTIVARGYHSQNPSATGIYVSSDISEGTPGLFLLDSGTVLVGAVPWQFVEANGDAQVLSAGPAVTAEVITLDMSREGAYHDPGKPVAVVRRVDALSTCFTYSNPQNFLYDRAIEPGQRWEDSDLNALRFVDPAAYSALTAITADGVYTVELDPSLPCDPRRGLLQLRVTKTGAEPRFVHVIAGCSLDGAYSIHCFGYRTYLSTIAL